MFNNDDGSQAGAESKAERQDENEKECRGLNRYDRDRVRKRTDKISYLFLRSNASKTTIAQRIYSGELSYRKKKRIPNLARFDRLLQCRKRRRRILLYASPSRVFYTYPYRDDDDGIFCNFTLGSRSCGNKDRLNGDRLNGIVRSAGLPWTDDCPSREAPDCALAFVSLAADASDDGGASPSESEY
jgi:hypothetical protein